MNHLMLDLETLGVEPGCIVLSIGAVMFDPRRGKLGEKFYANLEQADQRAAGLVANPATENWWTQQSSAAKARLLNPPQEKAVVGLRRFVLFAAAHGVKHVWGHGAGFDQPILRHAIGRMGLTPPWDFWNDRDTRTLYDLAGVAPDREKGEYHYALDDALRQAEAVCEGYAALGLTHHGWVERVLMNLNHARTGKYYAGY